MRNEQYLPRIEDLPEAYAEIPQTFSVKLSRATLYIVKYDLHKIVSAEPSFGPHQWRDYQCD